MYHIQKACGFLVIYDKTSSLMLQKLSHTCTDINSRSQYDDDDFEHEHQ